MSLLATIQEEGHISRLQRLRQNHFQFKLMIPAAIGLISGGMKMGWSIYELPSPQYDYNINLNMLTICWLIGVVLGVFVAPFVERFPKNVSHILSGFLLCVGGIIFALVPTTFMAIAFSCILEGVAFGLLQLQSFVTGAEVANKEIRGLVISTERCFIWFGILLQLTLTYIWFRFEPTNGHKMHVDQIHGIVVACLGIIIIICTNKLRAESPLLLFKQQHSEAADAVLKKLRGTYTTDDDLIRLREDYLQLLAVDTDGCCCFRKHNMIPLFKVLNLRCFVTLSMSQPFNHAFLSASWLGFDCDMNCLYTLTIAGLLGSLLGGLLIDRYGRRRLCVLTLLPATVLMFIAGGIMGFLSQAEVAIIPKDLKIIAVLVLLYQFIICLGVSTAATVYLSEAFTVTQKPYCISIILIAENLVQILMTIISFKMTVSATAFYFVLGAICLQLGLYVFLCMPETKGFTLYECLMKFKGVSLSK